MDSTDETLRPGTSSTARPGSTDPDRELLADLLQLRDEVAREAETTFARWRSGVFRVGFVPSARNLAAYLAFRRRDVRRFQDELAVWGLSSLGRSEAHVLASLEAVSRSFSALVGERKVQGRLRPRRSSFDLGRRLLDRNTRQLFGTPPLGSATHIMVTLPERAQEDADFVSSLAAHGMSCARINCAHGSHQDWMAMIRNVRQAEKALGRTCRVLMDLCGPRVRTLDVLSRGERRVLAGDRVLLRGTPPAEDPGSPPFQVQCAPPSIVEHIKPGALVLIDEGKVEMKAERVVLVGVVAEVTRAPPGGAQLKPEKGLNLPGTDLGLPALTEKDRADLDVVVANADMVGYSFVQEAADIRALWDEIKPRLERFGRRAPGLILKIETERAVHNLPELIVTAAGRAPTGVMIARGDLAVEVGFERLAELQEELLWLAEAAHTPIIWATQVLDQLVKKGMPSRAEISDVVLAHRAECVMLNKGEFLLDALTTVSDVFRRMEDHQHKKTARLRALRAWI